MIVQKEGGGCMVERWIQGFRFCIEDLIDTPSVRMMQQFRQHGDVTTLEHCLMVAFFSYVLCRIIGLNFYAAARGGLLHDLFLYDWHKPNPYPGLHGFTHPKTAWRNATRIYALTPMEQDIILTHMWPLTLRALPRYRESMVVSCADKLCALCETFGLVRHLRSTDTTGWIAKLCRETG